MWLLQLPGQRRSLLKVYMQLAIGTTRWSACPEHVLTQILRDMKPGWNLESLQYVKQGPADDSPCTVELPLPFAHRFLSPFFLDSDVQ